MNRHDAANIVHIAQALHQIAHMSDVEIKTRYGTHGVALLVQRGRETLARMAEELPCPHHFDPDGVCDWCGALLTEAKPSSLARVSGESSK